MKILVIIICAGRKHLQENINTTWMMMIERPISFASMWNAKCHRNHGDVGVLIAFQNTNHQDFA